jgi:hypothetical protein
MTIQSLKRDITNLKELLIYKTNSLGLQAFDDAIQRLKPS